MGQQCCSEENADRVYYQADRVHASNPDSHHQTALYQSPYKSHHPLDLTIKNFHPVHQIPNLHPVVKKTQAKLQPFKPLKPFNVPEGEKEVQAYALNNEGLVYNANGQWQNGVPHGKGELIYQDGSVYFGYFTKGVPHGEGRFVSSQGWYYEGDLAKEQAEGSGIFSHQDLGFTYQGMWAGDLPDGKGREAWVRANQITTYDGEYIRGKKHGKGIYKSNEGWVYEGTFSNNQITSSDGAITYKNNEKYQGHFAEGKKHGFGVYTWPDSSTFQGWYVNDMKQGHGKYTSLDGRVFIGEWKKGKREGRGELIVGNTTYSGDWRNDKLIPEKQFL